MHFQVLHTAGSHTYCWLSLLFIQDFSLLIIILAFFFDSCTDYILIVQSIQYWWLCVLFFGFFFFHSKTRNQIANQYFIKQSHNGFVDFFFLRAFFYLLPKLSFRCIDSLVFFFLYSIHTIDSLIYICIGATLNSIHFFFFLVDGCVCVCVFSRFALLFLKTVFSSRMHI